VEHIDVTQVPAALRDVRIVVASDVRNTLLGPQGAVFTFGPQKGARPDQLERLEMRMQRWAEVVERTAGRRTRDDLGTGAAGGVPFALAAVFGSPIEQGSEAFLELSGFDTVLADARLVITGEGRFDHQTLSGKAPLGVCRAAAQQHVGTVVVAGSATLTPAEARSHGFAGLYTLIDLEPDLGRAMQSAGDLLATASTQLAEDLLMGPGIQRPGAGSA
jgi:glycerate kinase